MTAPFGRRSAGVLEATELGAYTVVRVRDPAGIGCPPRAGQFYMLAAVDGWGAGEGERPFLPRACSVLSAEAGDLSFLLEDVGPGTRRLCALAAGEAIWLTGPLGSGFRPGAGRPVIVGGGIGIAPVLMLQRDRGGRALLGFRGAGHAAAAAALFGDCRVATDDGTVGHAGLVTDLLEAELDGGDGEATVYACGPPAMLEAVRSICARRGVAGQLALESPMACGFGACYGCVVATRDGYRRVCVDGPVFDAAVLAEVG
jgi:dihydroorotate dehydrogenase electron transfer subunit